MYWKKSINILKKKFISEFIRPSSNSSFSYHSPKGVKLVKAFTIKWVILVIPS